MESDVEDNLRELLTGNVKLTLKKSSKKERSLTVNHSKTKRNKYESTPTDVKCVCCLTLDDRLVKMTDTISIDKEELNYAELILRCFSLDIIKMNGGAELWLCRSCRLKVEESYNFRMLIVNSQSYLSSTQPVTSQFQSVDISKEEPLLYTDANVLLDEITYNPDKFELKIEPYDDDDYKQEPNDEPYSGFSEDRGEYYQQDSHNMSASENEKARNSETIRKWTVHTANEKCPLCKSIYKNFYDKVRHSFNKHKIIINIPDNTYILSCDTCNYIAGSVAEYRAHEHQDQIKAGKSMHGMVPCPICGLYTSNLFSRADHLCLYHCTDEKGQYVSKEIWRRCDICGEELFYMIDEIVHMYNRHKIDRIVEMLPPKALLDKCEECDQLFRYLSDYRRHCMIQHDMKLKDSYRAKISCSICGVYISRTYMEVHMSECHNYEMPYYQCEVCGESFNRRISFMTHIVRKHREIRTKHCPMCNKICRNVKKHMLTHSNERNFPCRVCGKSFKKKSTLDYHLKIHSAVKQFVCDLCGVAFTYKCSLKKHTEKHHKMVGLLDHIPC